MNTSETPSNAVRGFLPGYADESSPNYVPPAYRADYCTVELDPHLVEAMTKALWAYLEDERNRQIWEVLTERIRQRRGPDGHRAWVKQHTKRDGTPRYLDDAVQYSEVAEGYPKIKALTFEQIRDVEHRVALRQAKGIVEGAKRAAEAKRRREAQRKIYKTCTVCTSFPVDTETLANGDRACQPCQQVLAHTQAAQAIVPSGGSRQTAVERWLAASREELDEELTPDPSGDGETAPASAGATQPKGLLKRMGVTR